MTVAEILIAKGACEEAVEWSRQFREDAERAWLECVRPGWMFWIMGRVGVDARRGVRAAAEIALSVIHLTRTEDRLVCQAAIAAALSWCDGIGSAADAANAAAYATAAAVATAAANAAYAAYAAANAAANADANAAYAANANAAANAAYAAYAVYAAANANANAAYAAIVRRCVPWSVLRGKVIP